MEHDFTVQEIADYLSEEPTDQDLSEIEVCVRVIGRFEPGQPGRDVELVAEAVQSILVWMNDYGVTIRSSVSDNGLHYNVLEIEE